MLLEAMLELGHLLVQRLGQGSSRAESSAALNVHIICVLIFVSSNDDQLVCLSVQE